jgi:hypothetical protein
MALPARGGCLCGDIRYRIAGEPLFTDLCHCRSCRLASGAPVVAWLTVRDDDLVIDQGAPLVFRSSPSPRSSSCRSGSWRSCRRIQCTAAARRPNGYPV